MVFKGFVMSLSMFSILPVPKVWDRRAYCWIVPFIPVVGLIIGLLWYWFNLLLLFFSISDTIRSVGLLLFPLFISGFIHMDGFMDTCDAIFSRANLAKKRLILKDPHVGAFAVIAFGIYLIVGFACVSVWLDKVLPVGFFILIPVLSRCAAATALLFLETISDTGFGADFKCSVTLIHKLSVPLFGLLCAITAVVFTGGSMLVLVLVVTFCGAVSTTYSVRQFGGISGDLCGFIITFCELCAYVTLAFC